MIIRDVRREEKPILVNMMEDFYNRTGACLHDMDPSHLDATFEESLRDHTYARTLFIEEGGQIEGFCLLSFTWSNEVGGKVVLVEELYFRPEARGKGYGTKVFQWIEEEYPEAKRYRLEVTFENENAIALYKRLGYEELHYFQMVKEK